MKVAFSFLGMMMFTVAANLLLKSGAVSENATVPNSLTHLLNWQVMGGLVSFGIAAGFYITILQWLPLHVATSFAAAQYVAVILASALFLSEPIGFAQWLGIMLIASGIGDMGWSQR